MRRREGGGDDGDDGCSGDVGGVFSRSDRPINVFDMRVVKNLH
jgi:hypothetical protein